MMPKVNKIKSIKNKIDKIKLINNLANCRNENLDRLSKFNIKTEKDLRSLSPEDYAHYRYYIGKEHIYAGWLNDLEKGRYDYVKGD